MTLEPTVLDQTDRRVYLLADHLDMILAAGEDLMKLSLDLEGPRRAALREVGAVHDFVRKAKALEFAAIARVLRAREQAAELEQLDKRFALLARLFVAGTVVIADAAEELSDIDGQAFAGGDDPLAFLRTRGLIGEDAGCLTLVKRIAIDDEFLLAGAVEIGALLDVCATFLDALEEHFTLFPEIPGLDEPNSDVDSLEARP